MGKEWQNHVGKQEWKEWQKPVDKESKKHVGKEVWIK
jgi:hypothetical protein